MRKNTQFVGETAEATASGGGGVPLGAGLTVVFFSLDSGSQAALTTH